MTVDKKTDHGNDWTRLVRTGTRGVSFAGYVAIALFAGGFGVWAATAPLKGAAIVAGVGAVRMASR